MPNTVASQTVINNQITALFRQGQQAANPIYPTFCEIVPSTVREENYAHFGHMGTMRKWLGDRHFNKFIASEYRLKNEPWEFSLEIERHDYEDGRFGSYATGIKQAGLDAMNHPNKLLFQVLQAGASSECLDGQNFFDTDHAWGDSGVQSNKLASAALATANKPTEDEFRTAYHASLDALLTFKRPNGDYWMEPTLEPLDPTKLFLIVHTSLREVAEKALNKVLVSGGETNIVLNQCKILPVPYMTSPMTFHLIWTGDFIKPFVFQARKPLTGPEFEGMNSIKDKAIQVMWEARYNLGYAAWWNAVEMTLTNP